MAIKLLLFQVCFAQGTFEKKWKVDSMVQNHRALYQKLKNCRNLGLPSDQIRNYFARGAHIFSEQNCRNDTIMGYTHILLGMQLSAAGQYSDAIAVLERGLSHYKDGFADTNYVVHSAYYHLAYTFFLDRNIDQAQIYLDSALSVQWPCAKTRNWGRCLSLQGRLMAYRGNLIQAEFYQKIATIYWQKYPIETKRFFDLALAGIYRDLDLSRKVLSVLRPYHHMYGEFISTEIGQAYLNLGEYDSAVIYLEQVNALVGQNNPSQKWFVNNLASAYSHLGKIDQALDYYESVDTNSLSAVQKVIHQMNLAATYADGHRYDRALDVNAAAYKILPNLTDMKPNTVARFYANYAHHLLHALSAGAVSDHSWDFLDAGASELIKLRSQLQSPASRQNFVAFGKRFYDAAIKIRFLLFHQDKNPHHLEAALLYMEATKAMVLSEEFLKNRLRFDQDQYFITKYHDLEDKIDTATLLNEKIRYCDSLFQYLQLEGEVNSPTSIEASKKIQAAIHSEPIPGYTILAYFLHQDSSLSLITVNTTKINCHYIRKGDWYEDVVQVCLPALRKPSSSSPHLVSALNRLGRSLIPDEVWKENKPVLIIPDGMLSYFPFEALHSRGSSLIESRYVTYTFSLSLLHEISRFHQSGDSTIIFAPRFASSLQDNHIADMAYQRDVGPLQFNIKEAEGIRDHISDGYLVTGADATAQSFRDLAPSSSVLHLATHAFADSDEKVESQIFFSTSDQQGNVKQSQLYFMRIPADLVVLSACQTAIGKYLPGEGVMSFARAFTAAGAKSVVASLWAVNDQSTATIMINFYKHLKKGLRKDEALRLAKLDYLESVDPQYQHPYYWAGFIAVGDMSPLPMSKPWTWWSLVLLILVIVAIGVIMRRNWQNSES